MLEEKAPFWSQAKFFAVASVGFYADGWLNLTIGLVIPMLGYLYYKDNGGTFPSDMGGVIKAGLTIGMIFGQLTFGFMGDTLGRHNVYGKELCITMFGALLCLLLPWGSISHGGVVAWMTMFRIVTGFGIGGDYPMSSSLAAEKAPAGSRAKMVLSVFAVGVLGDVSAAILFVVLLVGYRTRIEVDIDTLQWVWRLLLAMGFIACSFTVYFRFRVKETKPYEEYVQKVEVGEPSLTTRTIHDQFHDFKIYFSDRQHAKALFALAASWFFYDIATYGVSLNQSIVLTAIGFGSGSSPYQKLWNIAIGNIIAICAGSAPGSFLGIYMPDLMGRRNLQLFSCLTIAILYAIWAGVTNSGSKGALIALFTLSQLITNAGPNITTFLNPVEIFPTRIRGTAHGIAAASGKCGAVLTAFAFGPMTDAIGIRNVLIFLMVLMLVVALLSFLYPEATGATLEDIENDLLFKQRCTQWFARKFERPIENNPESGLIVNTESSITMPKK